VRATILTGLLLIAGTVVANPLPVPSADAAGAKDSPLLARFAGSVLVSADAKDFDEMSLPVSALKQQGEDRDRNNNQIFKPAQARALEGRRTRLVYVLPAGVAPLQAIRNYQNEIKAKGGRILFECKEAECGGDEKRSSAGGGGWQSLTMYLWPQEKVKDKFGTIAWCAQMERVVGQRYSAVEFSGASAYGAILAFTSQADGDCGGLQDRAIVIVDLLGTCISVIAIGRSLRSVTT